MKPVEICTLQPGQRFRLFDDWNETPESTNDPNTVLSRVRGTVRHIGAGSACVKLESSGTRTIVAHDRLGEQKEVTVPVAARVEHWSLKTTVVPLEKE